MLKHALFFACIVFSIETLAFDSSSDGNNVTKEDLALHDKAFSAQNESRVTSALKLISLEIEYESLYGIKGKLVIDRLVR